MHRTHTPNSGHLLAAMAWLLAAITSAQSTGDYRSTGSGDWANASTWERFNGSAFVAAPSAPTLADGVITIRSGHTVTRNSDLTIDQVVVASGGTLSITAGGFSLSDGAGADLQILGTCSLSLATLVGPGLAQVASGGVLNISNGALGATSVLGILSGGTVNCTGAGTISALGTINNSGTWNMQGGNLGQPSFVTGPCAFNNLPGGVVNLNGWQSDTNTWHQVTNNQGTFTKNNGSTPFTFSDDFSGKSFTNAAGGVVTVASGELIFSCLTSNAGSMSAQAGGSALVSTAPAGTFTNASGGILQGTFRQNGGNLVLEESVSITQFLLEGGIVSGPGSLTIPTGESFNWTGGVLSANSVLNLQNGAIATVSGTGTRSALGTINNSGTWNMQGGNLGQPSFVTGPCAFNNLPSGVVNLNGWESNTNTWHQVTNNQGTFNKNNGSTPFTFSNDFSGKQFNNLSGGVLNATVGNVTFSCTVTNNGSMVASTGARFIHDTSAGGGPFTHATGGTVSGAFEQAGGTMVVATAVTLNAFFLTGGAVDGPEAITVPNAGTFNWTNGTLSATTILNLQNGSTATVSGTLTRAALGTINNSGTWNMQGGNLGQPSFVTGPCAFNNLPSGVVNLNGWESNTNTWHQVTNNQGTFNKNNGSTPFTFSNDFSGKQFTNLPGGAVNVNSGTLSFNVPLPLQNGTFNVSTGTTMSMDNDLNYAGPGIVNNGTIAGDVFRFQGGSAQTLDGTGSIAFLEIANAAGVDLGGDQTVTSTLTLTDGQLRLGDNDLFVENSAPGAVAGGNASSWVENNGSGSLHRQVAGSNFLFPIGTSSYTPLTLSVTTGPQDRFAARVQDGVSREYGSAGIATGSLLTSDVVDRTWVVNEQVPGGNTATIAVQWNASDELPLFNRTACSVANYTGTDWSIGTLATATGNGPFTRTVAGLASFRELCVADGDALLNDIGTAVTASSDGHLPAVWPNPARDVLHIRAVQGSLIQAIHLIDGQGRRIPMRLDHAGDVVRIDLQELASGVYLLEILDTMNASRHARVTVAQ